MQTVENTATTESVFDLGYIPSSKNLMFGDAHACYFTLADRYNIITVEAPVTDYFWRMIVMNIVEGHSEKHATHNTLSDSVGVFATGANHIDIIISGKILVSKTEDDSFVFLQEYVRRFRERQLAYSNKTLCFVFKDCTFNLIVQSITLTASVQSESYFDISVQGAAYGYKMLNSSEPLNLDYYGTTGSVSKSEALMTDETTMEDDPSLKEEMESTNIAGEVSDIAQAEPSSDPEVSVKYRETPSSTNNAWMVNSSIA